MSENSVCCEARLVTVRDYVLLSLLSLLNLPPEITVPA